MKAARSKNERLFSVFFFLLCLFEYCLDNVNRKFCSFAIYRPFIRYYVSISIFSKQYEDKMAVFTPTALSRIYKSFTIQEKNEYCHTLFSTFVMHQLFSLTGQRGAKKHIHVYIYILYIYCIHTIYTVYRLQSPSCILLFILFFCGVHHVKGRKIRNRRTNLGQGSLLIIHEQRLCLILSLRSLSLYYWDLWLVPCGKLHLIANPRYHFLHSVDAFPFIRCLFPTSCPPSADDQHGSQSNYADPLWNILPSGWSDEIKHERQPTHGLSAR